MEMHKKVADKIESCEGVIKRLRSKAETLSLIFEWCDNHPKSLTSASLGCANKVVVTVDVKSRDQIVSFLRTLKKDLPWLKISSSRQNSDFIHVTYDADDEPVLNIQFWFSTNVNASCHLVKVGTIELPKYEIRCDDGQSIGKVETLLEGDSDGLDA
jgi:hypothetical protein